MRRECTEAENRIIKESADDVLTDTALYKAAQRSIVPPILLGLVVGLGLGALLSLLFPISGELWIRLILFVCYTITIEIFVVVWQIYGNRKSKKDIIPGSKFWVNGGTVINHVNYNRENAYLIFAEDDLRDDMRNPCCIQFPALACLNIRWGERIILVYSDNGAYIPLKVTERTKNLIPMQKPDYFEKVDWSSVKKLPHPAVHDLDKTGYIMNENEVEAFIKSYNSLKGNQIRKWVAIILISFLILFLFAILFIGLVDGGIITGFSMFVGLLGFLLLVWGVLTFIVARGIFASFTKRLKELRYRKKVMFVSLSDSYENELYLKHISVYEYVNGIVKLRSYLVNGNVFLPKDIPYGRTICMYSRESESSERDMNIFLLAE